MGESGGYWGIPGEDTGRSREEIAEIPWGDIGDPVGGYRDYPGGPGLRSRGDPMRGPEGGPRGALRGQRGGREPARAPAAAARAAIG